jgi:hypothetical protein
MLAIARRSLAAVILKGAPFPAASARRDKPGDRSLGNQLPLELCQRSKNAEHKLAGGSRRVDRRTVTGQDLQSHATRSQVVHGIDQVAQIAAEPIELPYDQRIPFTKRLQASSQPWAIIASA